jgi:hypothetical protein
VVVGPHLATRGATVPALIPVKGIATATMTARKAAVVEVEEAGVEDADAVGVGVQGEAGIKGECRSP